MPCPSPLPSRGAAARALTLASALALTLAGCSGGGGAPSPQPSNPSPPDGATGVPTSTQLGWSAAAGAVAYEVFLGSGAALTQDDSLATTTQLSVPAPQLEAGETYFWRVDAIDGAGGRVASPVFRFQTLLPPDGLLTRSAAGFVALDGGAELPVTGYDLGSLGAETFLQFEFGAYVCDFVAFPPELGLLRVFVASPGSFAPTGRVELLLGDQPGTVYAAEGQAVDWDGGLSFIGAVALDDGAGGGPGLEVDFDVVFDQETTTFTVLGDVAVLEGTIGGATRAQMQALLDTHPEVETIEFGCILGSLDDTQNVQTGQLLRGGGLDTRAVSTSDVASGGVDLFTAGVERTVADGATFRVHAWEDAQGNSADDYQPCPGAPEHAQLVGFLNQMMGAPAGELFYCFTISFGVFPLHEMTPAEVDLYGLATQ